MTIDGIVHLVLGPMVQILVATGLAHARFEWASYIWRRTLSHFESTLPIRNQRQYRSADTKEREKRQRCIIIAGHVE